MRIPVATIWLVAAIASLQPSTIANTVNKASLPLCHSHGESSLHPLPIQGGQPDLVRRAFPSPEDAETPSAAENNDMSMHLEKRMNRHDRSRARRKKEEHDEGSSSEGQASSSTGSSTTGSTSARIYSSHTAEPIGSEFDLSHRFETAVDGAIAAMRAGQTVEQNLILDDLSKMQQFSVGEMLKGKSTDQLWGVFRQDARFIFNMLGAFGEAFEVVFRREGGFVYYAYICIRPPPALLHHLRYEPEFPQYQRHIVKTLPNMYGAMHVEAMFGGRDADVIFKDKLKELFEDGNAQEVILKMTKELFEDDFVVQGRSYGPLKKYSAIAIFLTPVNVYIHFRQEPESVWQAKISRPIFKELKFDE